ncbi:MAG: hypothetical protein U0169_24670 [Polyangiaceae bacterium]
MTGEHFDAVLKFVPLKSDKEGWETLPEGTTLSLHVAHGGVSLTVSRVEALKKDGNLVYLRGGKKETTVVEKGDVFAVVFDGSTGQAVRRAGFS